MMRAQPPFELISRGNLPGRFSRDIIYQLKARLSCRYFCEMIEGSRAGLLVLKFLLYQLVKCPEWHY
jgi:hypothetical protein